MKRKNISYLISLSVSIALALAIGALVLALSGFDPGMAYGEIHPTLRDMVFGR